MKKIFTLLLLFVVFQSAQSQTPDWSSSIADIIYSNCSSCHHEGGIAPFPLMSYEDAVLWSQSMKVYTAAKKMPPWPADPNVRHYTNEKILSQTEIDLIGSWVDGGTPAGNLTIAPAPPVFDNGASELSLSEVDQTLQIEPYTTQFNTDEYRHFVVHSGYTETMYINVFDIIPTLHSIVHHVDVYWDTTGKSWDLDQQDPLSGFNSSTGWPILSHYVGGISPGQNALRFPPNIGLAVPPNADFVLQIHYAPNSIGITDSTRLVIKFVDNPSTARPAYDETWIYDFPPSLINPPLKINANTIEKFKQKSVAMPTDMSFYALSPHMHMLGASYNVWFETQDGDSVPLVYIPQWDFNWQMMYQFQYVQKIPAGAKIWGEAVMDNTSNNPSNPNNPPITVSQGPYTTDEMLMTFCLYSEYQPGDEFILMDSSLLATGTYSVPNEIESLMVYPNLVKDHFHVEGTLIEASQVIIRLLNSEGQLIEQRTLANPQSRISEKIEMLNLPNGMYFLEVNSDAGHLLKKIIKQ